MTDKKRRQFVIFMGSGTAAVPLSALMGIVPSKADDEVPMVDELSVVARNWEYVSISAQVEKSCGNCALYQGEINSDSGPCPLFPYMRVSIDAWCNAYSPTPS